MKSRRAKKVIFYAKKNELKNRLLVLPIEYVNVSTKNVIYHLIKKKLTRFLTGFYLMRSSNT